jgi:hypothetical protein
MKSAESSEGHLFIPLTTKVHKESHGDLEWKGLKNTAYSGLHLANLVLDERNVLLACKIDVDTCRLKLWGDFGDTALAVTHQGLDDEAESF